MNANFVYVAEPTRNLNDWLHSQLDRVTGVADKLIDNDLGEPRFGAPLSIDDALEPELAERLGRNRSLAGAREGGR